VDWSALLARVEGDTELLRALVKLFVQECPLRLGAISLAIERNDPQSLECAAHRLKGGLVLFGAAAAVEASRQLEGIGRAKKLEEAGEVFSLLQDETQRLLAELAQTRE
jgi:HPt (histidine-containing phosphotransfer) domain-containing protein